MEITSVLMAWKVSGLRRVDDGFLRGRVGNAETLELLQRLHTRLGVVLEWLKKPTNAALDILRPFLDLEVPLTLTAIGRYSTAHTSIQCATQPAPASARGKVANEDGGCDCSSLLFFSMVALREKVREGEGMSSMHACLCASSPQKENNAMGGSHPLRDVFPSVENPQDLSCFFF